MDFLTPIAVITGVITGTAGLVLGIVNHLRDRAVVEIILQWEMVSTADFDGDRLGVVKIANIGRRPVFVSHVHMVSAAHGTVVVLMDSAKGEKLLEGDPPLSYTIPHSDAAKQIGPRFSECRAVVHDSAGKLYCSMLDSERQSRFGRIRRWWNCRRSRLYKLTPDPSVYGPDS